MDRNLIETLKDAVGEAIEARIEQAASAPEGSEEAEAAETARERYSHAMIKLGELARSYVVIGYGEDAEPNPTVYQADSPDIAAGMFKAEWGGQDIHGIYPGDMGTNVFSEKPAERHMARYDDPQVFRMDVVIAGTAYVKAHDALEAWRRVRDECQAAIDLESRDIEVSDLPYDHAELPDVSLSPCATVLDVFPGWPEEAD